MNTPLANEQIIDIGGYSLYIKSMGSGSPTVIMEAGGTRTAESWQKIQPQIAHITCACAYDRAGLGHSESGPVPTTSLQMVEELHQLLANIPLPGPYILVGHSFGALNVRLYAHQYPDEVLGLVLVDPAHEDLYAHMDTKAIPWIDFRKSAQQVRETGSLGNRPLIVLSHGLPVPDFAGVIEASWLSWHRQLVQLSSHSLHVIATRSRHAIQEDQPEIVIEAIRQVIEAARDPSHTFFSCAEIFHPLGGRCIDLPG
ncbi:MAG TPA: alpha/beta hydrolase [Ktedonobacteraceae bacterium]|nr:alpha/beta hydrolase [Ktedonobacteraceae bacterium]